MFYLTVTVVTKIDKNDHHRRPRRRVASITLPIFITICLLISSAECQQQRHSTVSSVTASGQHYQKVIKVSHPLCANLTASLASRFPPSETAVNVGVLVDTSRYDECQRLAVIIEAAAAANSFLAKLLHRSSPSAGSASKSTTLRFYVNSTNDLIGDTMTSLYAFFNNNEGRFGRPVDYILGPTRESIIKAVLEVAMFRQVPVISYAQTSPLVLSPSSYSSLVRIGLTSPDYHWAVAKLVRSFHWSKVTLVIGSTNSTNDPTDLAIAHFEHIAKLQGISVTNTIKINFVNHSMLLSEDQVKLLNNIFHRIVVAFLDGSSAIELLCRLNRPFSALLWIFVGSFSTNWLQDEQSLRALSRCPFSASRTFLSTTETIQSFIDSSFVIDTGRQHSGINTKKLSRKQFQPAACRMGLRNHKMTKEMRQAWDAVWLLAAVTAQGNQWSDLSTVRPLEMSSKPPSSPDQRVYLIPRRFQVSSDLSIANRSMSSSRPLLIDCLSGPIVLEDGARRPVFRVYQIQNSTMYPVMYYHPLKDSLSASRCEVCRQLEWRMGRPPKDAIIEHIERHTTPLWLSAIVFFATGCGATMAISFFVFTIVNRKERIIKLSAPALTAIFAIGSTLLYLLLPFLSHSASIYSLQWNTRDHFGWDEVGPESQSTANATCTIRYLLLFCGFTCAFCSVALRTYKIYIATTSIGRNALKSKFLRDERMLVVIGGMVVIDVVLVVTWSQVIGFEFVAQNETQYYDAEMDHLITYQSVECSTPNSGLFFAVCCSWKMLIISFGLFLAWRIHGVKIKVLNDAKFIGAISYIIVISGLVIGVIHVVGLSHSGVATYLLDVAIAVSANTLCLLLNFLPKVLAIYRRENAILCSEGFIEQGGTRRFTSNTESEHVNLAGVETQNYLLRLELSKLTLRVDQLEAVNQRRGTKEINHTSSLSAATSETTIILKSLSVCRTDRPISASSSPRATYRRKAAKLGPRKSIQYFERPNLSKGSSLSKSLNAVSQRQQLSVGETSEKLSIKTLVTASNSSSAFSLMVGIGHEEEKVSKGKRGHLDVPVSRHSSKANDKRKAHQTRYVKSVEQLEQQLSCLDAELRRALNFSLKSLAEI